MAGQVTITGNDTGSPAGQRVLGPLTVVGSATVGATSVEGLASGDNTLSVPPGATGCVIIPPQNGAVALKLRSSLNSGDAGLPISANQPSEYTFPTGGAPTTLILNAGSAQAALLTIWWF